VWAKPPISTLGDCGMCLCPLGKDRIKMPNRHGGVVCHSCELLRHPADWFTSCRLAFGALIRFANRQCRGLGSAW
jgi:hypothetical protein